MGPYGLPFAEVVLLDTEFYAPPGELPVPVALVAHEVGADRWHRIWGDDLGDRPPFPTDASTLVVAFFASAEWSVFLARGWQLPARIIDLFAEFRALTNGRELVDGETREGRSLLAALTWFGIPSITSAQKEAMRARIMEGPPYTSRERREILDYCETDVAPLGLLLERMLPHLRHDRLRLGQALFRGRYTAAVARVEANGVPIDVPTLERLRAGWDRIRGALIAEVDDAFGVYDGSTFVMARFEEYLHRAGILHWPRHEDGTPRVDGKTMEDMVKSFGFLQPLYQLRHSIGQLRHNTLAVGSDARNRTLLGPFSAHSGRNIPKAGEAIFSQPAWLRSLIKPPPGWGVAYLDWKHQEVDVAAVVSGDDALMAAALTTDPYITFAIGAGHAPAGATKKSHPEVRDRHKTCLLGAFYGMQRHTMAAKANCHPLEADEMLWGLRQTFPVFTNWAENIIHHAQIARELETLLGWPIRVTAASNPNALRNFPIQGGAADMMRVAACLITEAGVRVCAIVHDAFLIEAPLGELDDAIETTRAAMAEASRLVLGGHEVGVDVSVTRYPGRYVDGRGQLMWTTTTGLLDRFGVVAGGASAAAL